MPLTGDLRLEVGLRSGRTVAVDRYHRGALKLLRPFPVPGTGWAAWTVLNPGGGYLSGDDYRMELTVGEGAGLDLTTQAATKVYRSTGPAARQESIIRVGPGALLDHRPEPLILYRDADYRQLTTAEVDPSGTLILSEILTAGWSPDLVDFAWRRLLARTEVRVGGRLCMCDTLLVEPGVTDPRRLGLGAAQETHLATLVAFGPGVAGSGGPDGVRAALGERAGIRVGIGELLGGGVVVRAVAGRTDPLRTLVDDAAAVIRHALGGPARRRVCW